jgi:hypothetical protein
MSASRLVSATAGWAAACLLVCGSAAQAQSTIANVYPDGKVQFQSTNSLSFTASSPDGVTNITVELTGTKMTGEASLKVLTMDGGLTATGDATSKSVSAPLKENMRYSANIHVTDTKGASTNSIVSFDTIAPSYTWEVEDFDYDSGKYIDNPQTNAYSGLIAAGSVDAYNTDGGAGYRPVGTTEVPGGLSTEGCGDVARAQYVGTGKTDYDVGFTSTGDWANYTRHYPAGKYNVFIRASNPNGSSTDTIEIAGPVSGRFNVPATGGWQVYTWVPLKDIDGNLVEFLPDGSAQTLLVSTMAGTYNANFFMLLPAITASTDVSDATFSDMYPDGLYQFQATNRFVFTVNSSLGVNPSDIVIQLAATNLTGQGTSTLLTSGSGLTVGGSSTSRTVGTPLTSNTVYRAFIQITDANGVSLSTNVLFDTITPAYTWEAEDWDYNGGLYLEDPQIDGYTMLDGLDGVDFARPSTGGGNSYSRAGLATENAGDVARLGREGYQDYDIGNNGGGNWVNYTRNWPVGVYNVYIRVANGNSGQTTDSGSLSEVTSGVGTANQTVSKLGTYNSPGTGGWQAYSWQPLYDAGGNLIKFTGGSVKTLRHTVDGGNANQGFYMLIPANLEAHTLPYANNFVPDGSSMFQLTNVLSFTVNSAAGISTNDIVLTLNGTRAVGLVFSGSANTWKATCPVSLNAFYRVVATLKDAYGSSTNKFEFSTFDPAKTYIFEAEDYDFNGGMFLDNPQVNGYAWLDVIAEVDTHTVSGNFDGTHVAYRLSGLNQENASDVFELPEHTGFQNYDLGSTAAGNWGNYTRTYPAGNYNIYMRAANGNTGNSTGGSMELVTSGLGTVNQTTTSLGTFEAVPATGGWQTYTWVALRDNGGNLVKFTGGSVKTLRAICGGGQNMDYYALVPEDPTMPVLSGLYPDGSAMFQQTNTLSFVAASTAGIDSNSIVVTVNGTVATNLVVTGSSTSWNVSYPNLVSNSIYSANIYFYTKNSAVVSKSFNFDTFSSSYYTWEAEDFNYGNGKFIDNPQTNAYSGLIAVDMVDAHNTDGNPGYRPVGTTAAPGGLATEAIGDIPRVQYIGTGMTDYNVGYTTTNDWANYTRTFPKGTYNIYMRASNPNAYTTDAAEISGSVTGRFNVPSTGNWQGYTWVPLVDADSNNVVFAADGSAQTMKIATMVGTYNVNFYMLVPATATSVTAPVLTVSRSSGNIVVSFPTKTGANYQLEYKSQLNDATWTSVGSSVAGNGAVQSVTDPIGAVNRFYRVRVQ